MASELVHQSWTRITGRPWSDAKKLGLTDGSYNANIALQKRLLGGWNPFAAASSPAPSPAPAQSATPATPAADPLEAYKKVIADWYAQKPATPSTFNYSDEQRAADTRSVSEQYRPFYQEKATQAGDEYTVALQNARQGFSRRGLWGAAGGTQQATDPKTGLTYTVAGAPTNTGGPVSGLRQVGETQINKVNEQQNTAFGRAYTEATAGGVQQRQAEAQDVYQKTVVQPYEEQYKNWLSRMASLQAAK